MNIKHAALWLGALAWLLTMAVANGQLVFSDNFQEFTNGTVLSGTNYTLATSALWTEAEVQTNGASPGSAIASNLLGSIRLFIDVSSPGNHIDYQIVGTVSPPNPTPVVTNQVVNMQWLSWIETTKSLTATGGLAVMLSGTNLDISCTPVCDTNLDFGAPLFYGDNGMIYAFTNNVKETPMTMVQIGTWSNYVGTIMTNQLTVNYPAGTFSLWLNGTVVTNNMSLPITVTNLLNQVGFSYQEALPSSTGNRFALDDILVTIFTPTINTFQVVGRTNAIISFTTLLGTSYDVERNDQIGVQAWTNFIQNVPGTGGIVQTNDTFGASLQKRFYRVRLLP